MVWTLSRHQIQRCSKVLCRLGNLDAGVLSRGGYTNHVKVVISHVKVMISQGQIV